MFFFFSFCFACFFSYRLQVNAMPSACPIQRLYFEFLQLLVNFIKREITFSQLDVKRLVVNWMG